MKLNPRNIGYCKGFVHGYEEGIRNNPYDGWEGKGQELLNHIQYDIGYDAGVEEYCKEIDIENNE